MRTLSRLQARQLILQQQGLLNESRFDGALPVIEQLGYVQIDTISVVERAHHHVLYSRRPAYKPSELHGLLAARQVFEYWSHAASYLPMRDYRFALPRQRLYRSGRYHWFKPTPEHAKWRRRILAQIRSQGPQSARDFADERESKRAGWFDWKPAKQILEQLFMEGVLMVSERRGFVKTYDLAERVLPAQVDTRMPTRAEYAWHLIEGFLRAQGLGRLDQVWYQRRSAVREEIQKAARRGLKDGRLCEVRVEGLDKPFVALSATSIPERPGAPACRILSPFDNLLIQRRRTRELFDFEYTIECYTPQAKRKFGYFALPVLLDGELIGNIDLKADRGAGVLRIQGRHLPRLNGEAAERFQSALQDFARFNACPKIAPLSSARTRRPLEPAAPA